MTRAALPAVRPADPWRPLLDRWSIEAAELARHLDALPLPSADMLHRRLIDVADLAEALGVSVPRLVTVAQLVAAHVVAVVALLEARR